MLTRVLLLYCLFTYITPLAGQEATLSKTCYMQRAYCLFTQNGLQGLMDTTGQVLIPAMYHKLLYTDHRDFFLYRQDKGYGVLSIEGQVILIDTFQHQIKVRDQFIIAIDSAYRFSVYTWHGEQILPSQFQHIKFLSGRPEIIWAKKDAHYYPFDHTGTGLSQTGFLSFNRIPLGKSVYAAEAADGMVYILGHPHEEALLAGPYRAAYRVPGHSSCAIVESLPDHDGLILKRLYKRYGKYRSDRIYEEICFEKDCLEPFTDRLNLPSLRRQLFQAIGILPDGSYHLFDEAGKKD